MRRILLAAALTLVAATAHAQYSPFRSGYSHGVRPYYAIQQQQSRLIQQQQNYWRQNPQQLMFWQIQQLIRQSQPSGFDRIKALESGTRTRSNFRRFRIYDANGRYRGYAR